MRWIEVTVETQSAEIEEVCLRLSELGIDGMLVEDESDFQSFLENNRQYWDYVDEDLAERFCGVCRVKFYLSDDEAGRAALETVRRAGFETKTGFVEDADWENNWKDYYQPIEVGEKLLVLPEWEPDPGTGRIPLRLDPGLTFGTGSHATTQMCLRALEELVAPGMTVLDLGCGSGILGIGALLLGAGLVRGCDIDPKAPEVALANASLNGIGADRFDIRAGDILTDAGLRRSLGGDYGLVCANIVADVIIPLAPLAYGFLAPGGRFLTSGIIDGREAEVRKALEQAGFTVKSHDSREEWHCFVCEK